MYLWNNLTRTKKSIAPSLPFLNLFTVETGTLEPIRSNDETNKLSKALFDAFCLHKLLFIIGLIFY